MALSLNETLKDSKVLEALRRDPESFRFKNAPYVILTLIPFYTHPQITMRLEDIESHDIKNGVPAEVPVFGPLGNMVEILSSTMNFTYRVIAPPDRSWGARAEDGTWSGMVGQVFRKEADIGLAPFAVIKSRFEDTDMTIPYYYDNLNIFSARGSAAINPWAFLLPFTPAVWVYFVASLILVCTVHFVIEALGNKGNERDESMIGMYSSTLFKYIQPPFDHAIMGQRWRNWQLPLIGSWILTSLLMNLSYGGNLKSMMALRYIPHPIQTIRDLIKDTSKKIIVEHRSAFTFILDSIPSGDIKELNDVGKAGRYADYATVNFMNHVHLLLDGSHVQIFDTVTSLFFNAKLFSQTGRCQLYLARETFIPFMYSLVIQKHNPITPAVNARIRRVFEAGLYNFWMTNNIDNSTACRNPPMITTSSEAIRFDNIWGVAVVWGVGMFLATVAVALELTWAKFTKNDDLKHS